MKLNKIRTGMIVLTMLLISIVLISSAMVLISSAMVLISSAMVPTEEPATLRNVFGIVDCLYLVPNR